MESSAKQRTRLINQLHGLLARVFPELAVSVKDLSANWVLSLLEKYPTPDKLARATPEMLAKIPHLATDMAETLRAAAAQSTASNRGPIAALVAKIVSIERFATPTALIGYFGIAWPNCSAKSSHCGPRIAILIPTSKPHRRPLPSRPQMSCGPAKPKRSWPTKTRTSRMPISSAGKANRPEPTLPA
jgi:hypothetical protein